MTVYEDARACKYSNNLPFGVTSKEEYRAETARLEAEFKADLEREYGFVGHPKADAIYALAWDYGHSAGYSEVAMYYDELAQLL